MRHLQHVVVPLVAAVLLTGCASGELTDEDRQAAAAYGSHAGGTAGHHPDPTPSQPIPSGPSASAAATASTFHTWQELAETVGCTATLQGKAADFRQAACVHGEDTFVFLDFDTAEGQRDWLEYALLYGGVYLVGDRWALSGRSREYLESLRPTLGGEVRADGGHAGP